ncbi:hypothetical protein [Jiangella anatolica]|uniref:Uncharacterized protein n=1 Tax=Jiangella anatolica TaxID=2670374 RepID=A0A2W2BIN0_9ACTN|nr:hypothetical protein [Jiangella anatolica]PZF80168.1 hypothetical protein C1I92_27475 [Jiangella anatolica]
MAAVGSGIAVAPAAAAPLERDHFHESFSEVIEDCGLTLRYDFEEEGAFLFNAHKQDRLAYAHATVRQTQAWTNVANDKTLTVVRTFVDKDLRVTDNGDGTLTILVLSTGNETVYTPDGKALHRNPGQIRFEILVDHGGTPTDPSDDEEIAFLGIVKGSTGRNDDFGEFCDDVQEFLT